MNPTQLAARLNGLGYSARHRQLLEIAREPEVEGLIDTLAMGDAHQASLALTLADHADRPHLITALLDHPAWTVRRSVVRRLARRGLPVDLERMDPATRSEWLQQIASHGQTAIADDLIDPVRSRYGDHAGALLLRACSSEVVRRILPEVEHAISIWSRLARRHPDVILDFIQTAFVEARPSLRGAVWQRFASAWSTLARLRPDPVAQLIDTHVQPDALPPIPLHALRPDHLRRLVLRESMRPTLQQQGLPVGLQRRLDSWSDDDITTLLDRLGRRQLWSITQVLQRLRLRRRGPVFEGIEARWGDVPWGDDLVALLPHDLRARVAEKKLARSEMQADLYARIRALANTSPEVAGPALGELGKAADAGERGAARAAGVTNTLRYDQSLAAHLASLAPRVRNEQDPVRHAVFQALRPAGARSWTPEALVFGAEMIADALAARDCSQATRRAIQGIGARWVRTGATLEREDLLSAGIETLRSLVERVGELQLPLLETLSPSAAHRVIDALGPHLEDANARERYTLVLKLARALGRQGHDSERLQARLEEAVFSRLPWIATQALELWLADQRHRDERVQRALDRDRSLIAHPRVFRHLHLRRQEWLDPYLSPEAATGVFMTGRTLHLPRVDGGYHRWLPRQHRAYAAALTRIAADPGHPTEVRVQVVRALARVPSTTLEHLSPWLESDDISIQEAALAATVWTAHPTEAIPVLAGHLATDRARVAMYAFQRCVRYLPTDHLARVLQVLLRDATKVTVVKEVLRLSSRFRIEGCTTLLREVLVDTSRHRDIRIAALSGLRDHLDEDPVFEACAVAAAGEPDLCRALLLAPEVLPRRHRRRWYAIVEPLFAHPDDTVRASAFATGAAWLAVCPTEIATIAARHILDLEQGRQWRTASGLLAAAAGDGLGHTQIAETIERLQAMPQANADAHRDRPASQRRDERGAQLCALPLQTRERVAPLLLEIAQRLASDPSTGPLQMHLALHAAAPDRLPETLSTQAEVIAAHPDALSAWTGLAASALARLPDGNTQALSTLQAGPWPARVLALTLLTRIAAQTSWTEGLRKQLRDLREDEDPRVRHRALRLHTHRE